MVLYACKCPNCGYVEPEKQEDKIDMEGTEYAKCPNCEEKYTQYTLEKTYID